MTHLSLEPILARIHQAEAFDEMRCVRDQVQEMFREHLLLSYTAELGDQINLVHDAFIKRTAELAELMLEAEGVGKPPVEYAFFLLGSGGRSEQTLWSDQDNGLIYEGSETYPQEALEGYFSRLVSLILHGLDVLGYPPCEGNVVSSNPQWRKSEEDYRAMAMEWLLDPNWENMRYLLIVADIRCIYGAPRLVERLKSMMLTYIAEHPTILDNLLSNTLRHKISLGIFGQLITERYGEDAGGFDIKYGAYIPIVNGIRLLAIQAGIAESSTMTRIRMLREQGVVAEPLTREWETAFGTAIRLRNATPFQLEEEKYTTRGRLTAEQLTKETRQMLKHCLRTGVELQKYVAKSIESYREKG
ncbi:DUF294 nucleotidyltransferase-like domain-containing protein [Paenibacillus ferrarius]|uniref:DUF294 nucleotidyltransferase-like domain-containing protein n=1 Tax=Paenibacillus ferrarius TaxID=1469647 RepID=UPI003D266A47